MGGRRARSPPSPPLSTPSRASAAASEQVMGDGRGRGRKETLAPSPPLLATESEGTSYQRRKGDRPLISSRAVGGGPWENCPAFTFANKKNFHPCPPAAPVRRAAPPLLLRSCRVCSSLHCAQKCKLLSLAVCKSTWENSGRGSLPAPNLAAALFLLVLRGISSSPLREKKLASGAKGGDGGKEENFGGVTTFSLPNICRYPSLPPFGCPPSFKFLR